MKREMLTLAIHTPTKANILKAILEDNGIDVCLEPVDNEDLQGETAKSVYVKVHSEDLARALVLIEANGLFSYDDKKTYQIDDGRKRILVAVDFSRYSMKACQIAFDLAKKNDAKVKILHIYHHMYFPSHIPFADTLKESSDEGLLDKARKQMLDLCLEIDRKIAKGEWPSVNYSYSLREGVVEEEIDSFILEYKPSLLVLGTKGKSDDKNYMLGSVTADVIEMTNVPVLAIPENSPIGSLSDVKHVAFLTNLQARDLSSFETLVGFLKSYSETKVTLVHINRINRKGDRWNEMELAKMKEHFLKQYPQLNIEYQLIDSPDIPLAIANFTKEQNVTAVCINTRRRNIFGRIFMPSISRKVLFKSDVALLVLRG